MLKINAFKFLQICFMIIIIIELLVITNIVTIIKDLETVENIENNYDSSITIDIE